ncbi:hypothetical protein ACPJXG_12355 [Janthinobacterium sp. NFX145]|uniref:hypothetical protein n=1 Tax=Janthinobacterium sp. NFX145 TaxID=3415602 RepID=UPI003CC5976C
MELIQWTLFIDMLGYRDINGSIESDKVAMDFISFMDANKKILDLADNKETKEKYAKNEHFNLYKYYEISSCLVSDSIIITYKPKQVEDLKNIDLMYMHSANALFIITIRLQALIFHCFSERGIFLRGGISNKYCLIKDNFAVGTGLIEAYAAESKIAIHPRVVLHPEIEKDKVLMSKIKILAEFMYNGRPIIQKDSLDELLFLDYIGYAISSIDVNIPMIAESAKRDPLNYLSHVSSVDIYIKKHYEAIQKKLTELKHSIEKEKDNKSSGTQLTKVLDKFLWLAEYHNKSISNSNNLKKYHIQTK